MALVALCLPNMEFKASSVKHLTVCKGNLIDAVPTFRHSEVTSIKFNRKRHSNFCHYSSITFPPFGRHSTLTMSASWKMVSNGSIGRDTYSSKIYKRLDGCLVIPPLNGMKPRAIIKFLGGAFIGAVPEVTYGHFMYLLAKEGFLIVSVPYNVTFDHAQAAKEVYKRFNACTNVLYTSGLPCAYITVEELVQLPVYSVGHSNGALLQLLTGSYFSEKIPKVTQGTSEFKPTPSENRDFVKKCYNVSNTLLVKFNVDPIDESDLLEEILKPRVESMGGTLEKVTLTGNHLTPCIQDLKWQVGHLYTPADAVAQRLKALSLNDTKELARTIADWFTSIG